MVLTSYTQWHWVVLKNKDNSLSTIGQSTNTSISPSGLNQRFNKEAVDFLTEQLHRSVKQLKNLSSRFKSNRFKRFNRILIHDSTCWDIHNDLSNSFRGNGGNASKAGIKVHLLLDYLSSAIININIKQGAESDQGYSKFLPTFVSSKDLILFDLGYFKLNVLAEIAQKGAYYITRHHPSSKIFNGKDVNSKEVNIPGLLHSSKSGQVDIQVYLGTRHKLPCRFVAIKLPSNKHNEKLRRAKRQAVKSGQPLSKKKRRLLSWNIYITNVDSNELSSTEIPQAYRVRWTIELLFKQFKSTMQIHSWNHANTYRLQCEILGTFIVSMLIMSLHGIAQSILDKEHATNLRDISLEKVFKFSSNNAEFLFRFISLPICEIQRSLKQLVNDILKRCIKETRELRISSRQRLFQMQN